MRTRSQSRKENLEKEEEESVDTMADPAANPKALMDFSKPKINDIQSMIFNALKELNSELSN